MLTRTEAERLAQAVNALRPSWPVASLMTFLEKRKDRAQLDLALELVFVALDPDTNSPARIDVDGPWKRLQHGGAPGTTYRSPSRETCIVCGDSSGWEFHQSRTHEFENPLVTRKSALPTPEQRAAIDKAAAEAREAATAAKEAQAERELRDPAEVIASHTTPPDTPARHQPGGETL